MDLIDSTHPDVAFVFFPESKPSIEGNVSGEVYKDGRRYTIIDSVIAVQEQSTISKVMKQFAGYIASVCLVGGAIATTSVIASGLLIYSAVLVSLANAIFNKNVKIGQFPPPFVEFKKIQSDRQEVKEIGMVAFCEKEKGKLFKSSKIAFTNDEIRAELKKDAQNYRMDELIDKLGWDAMLNYLSQSFLENKMKIAG